MRCVVAGCSRMTRVERDKDVGVAHKRGRDGERER